MILYLENDRHHIEQISAIASPEFVRSTTNIRTIKANLSEARIVLLSPHTRNWDELGFRPHSCMYLVRWPRDTTVKSTNGHFTRAEFFLPSQSVLLESALRYTIQEMELP